MTILDLVHAQQQKRPGAIAIAGDSGRSALTYEALHQHITVTAAALNASGIRRNDRVAIVLPNGPEMATAFLSVAACATSAPLNPAYRREEFDFYLSDLNAAALIVQDGAGSPAAAAATARGIPVLPLRPLVSGPAGLFTLERHGGDDVEPECMKPNDTALVLHTSGTTAKPKIVPLTQANLCASAANVAGSLSLSEADRCLNVMPLFHIHGLVAALLASLQAGASVVCTAGFYAPEFLGWLQRHQPTWYTAVPTMHQAILAQARKTSGAEARSSLRLIRSSSSALAPRTMEALEQLFHAPVIEAYGMTEAAHQIASNPLPPGVRKPGSVGLPAGPDITVMDGEVVIRGANVTRGYENNQAANESAFTGGWFRTGDQGYIDADGYLTLTGRLKEIINRGGEKISPREIDELLLDHPAVAQAVTFAIPDHRLGEDVAAAIVLHPGQTVTAREIRSFAATRIADFKVPSRIVFLDEIPKGPTGKLQRIGLAGKLGLEPAAAPGQLEAAGYEPPRTAMEKIVSAIWARVLELERVGIHDEFLAIGGDSMLAARIIGRITQELRLELTVSSFLDLPTVASQAAALEELLLNEPEVESGKI